MGETYEDVLRLHPDRIPTAFDHWVRRFGIEKDLRYSVCYTAATWSKYASPAQAPEEHRVLALMELSLGCLYPDDYPYVDFEDLFDDYCRNFDGVEPHNPRPVIRAHAAYLGLLRALNRPMEHFVDIRKKLMAEYAYRNRVSRGEITTSFEKYKESRYTTSYQVAWFEFWIMVENVRLTEAERKADLLVTALRSSTAFNFMADELHSYDRDMANGIPNLVALYCEEQRVTPSQAAEVLAEQMDGYRRAADDATARLDAPDMSPGLRRSGQLLQLFMAAATPSRSENPERYAYFTG